MANFTHPFDKRLEHRAVASAALTATATLATITERAAQRTAYRTLVGIEALDIASNDELYQIVIECSNDSFSTVETAAIRDFGATEVRQSGAPDTAVGDEIEILWTTEIGATKYAASRIRLIVAGTSPSVTLFCHSTVLGSV
ncbi:MAG: hypothetical protein ACPG4X_16500 [Pikeienuella sp.]